MQTREQVRAHARWLIRRDLEECLAIEDEFFPLGWGEEEFRSNLRQRDVIAMVAEVNPHTGEVGGYMVYRLDKERLYLLNMAVRKDLRRQGVGESMVRKLAGKLSSDRRTAITADVRESNVPAQLFLRSMGFRSKRVVRGFYEDTGEDAYVMEYCLPENSGGRHPFEGVGCVDGSDY